MSIKIVSEDITRMEVDAVVNAANSRLAGGGGVDGAIHRAAGPELHEACKRIGGCPTGEAVVTWAYEMDHAIYIIHTVGPIWQGGSEGEEELLRSCYKKSLELAKGHDCRSVAFPLISGGVYGYPKRDAVRIAIEESKLFLESGNKMEIYITLTDKEAFKAAKEMCPELIEE